MLVVLGTGLLHARLRSRLLTGTIGAHPTKAWTVAATCVIAHQRACPLNGEFEYGQLVGLSFDCLLAATRAMR